MNRAIVNLGGFTIGFVVGYGVPKLIDIFKQKKSDKNPENESENFPQEDFSENDPDSQEEDDEDRFTHEEYQQLLDDCGYADEVVGVGHENPYVISPDEFGELYNYSKISLTLYSDGALCDENDELVEDIERTVGKESLKTFGQYEDDSVFVRNDRLMADFEILLDQCRYEDVVEKKPMIIEV